MVILAFYGLSVLLILICLSLVAKFSKSEYWALLEPEEIAIISIFFPILVPFILMITIARLISGY